jgi:hypothetical protein
MEEQLESTELEHPVKKRGNPNFGKKKYLEEDELTKSYHFVLTKTWEKYKPVDKEGGFMSSNPYPPTYMIPSQGTTIDDETKRNRKWRCLRGVDTIWVDEQDGLEPNGYGDYEELIFSSGHLIVKGYEKNKLAALKAYDGYEDKKYRKVNSTPEYRLIDLDADNKKALDTLDTEYEALKAANECSDEEMLPFAYVLGINIDQSYASIRREFIMRAKGNPKYFVTHFSDAKNDIVFKVKQALDDNILSGSILENKLVWSESKKVIMDVPKGSDIPQLVAKQVLLKNSSAVSAYEQLKKM